MIQIEIRGLVYIGKERKNLTYGRYYSLIDNFPYYSIMDNCGSAKKYARNDIWLKENFKLMKKKEYVIWSRSIKLNKLKAL